MVSTAILVLGVGLIIACAIGVIAARKWTGWQRITHGRGLISFGKAAGRHDAEPPSGFEFVVVGNRKPTPDERLLIETLAVGEPVMLIEETSEDGHTDFRVVASDGTIGHVGRNRVPALQAIAAAGANMRCEISYVVRQPEGVGIWVRVDVLPEG